MHTYMHVDDKRPSRLSVSACMRCPRTIMRVSLFFCMCSWIPVRAELHLCMPVCSEMHRNILQNFNASELLREKFGTRAEAGRPHCIFFVVYLHSKRRLSESPAAGGYQQRRRACKEGELLGINRSYEISEHSLHVQADAINAGMSLCSLIDTRSKLQ
jgi:hypothetical protein